MRDLISDINYCSSAVFVRYRTHDANDVSAYSGIFVLLTYEFHS